MPLHPIPLLARHRGRHIGPLNSFPRLRLAVDARASPNTLARSSHASSKEWDALAPSLSRRATSLRFLNSSSLSHTNPACNMNGGGASAGGSIAPRRSIPIPKDMSPLELLLPPLRIQIPWRQHLFVELMRIGREGGPRISARGAAHRA